MSEIIFCNLCRQEFEALTNELASYLCPKCSKPKTKLKILDHVRNLSLTKVDESDETQTPKQTIISTNDVKRKT